VGEERPIVNCGVSRVEERASFFFQREKRVRPADLWPKPILLEHCIIILKYIHYSIFILHLGAQPGYGQFGPRIQ